MIENRWRVSGVVAVAAALALGIAGYTVAAAGEDAAAPRHYVRYYVDMHDKAAADTNDGSQAAPWKTIAHAAAVAKPGDEVLVKPGLYDELVTVTVSGTKDKLLRLRSEKRREARVKGFVLKGDYISIEGFEITGGDDKGNGIFAGEAHRKTARTGCRMLSNFLHDLTGTAITSGEKARVGGNLMRNVGRGAFVNSGTLFELNEIDTLVPQMVEKNGQTKPKKTQYTFFSGDDITFRNNYFHGAPEKHLKTGMGVCFFASWDAWIFPSSHRILIENNRCSDATHASEPTATVKKESSHITYRNNVFVNTVFVGVMPKAWSHVTVENNTFINCGAYPVWLQGKQCETAVVRNNLIAYYKRDRVVQAFGWKKPDAGVRLDFQGAKGFCDYNVIFGTENRKYGKHDITAEPQFVDPAGGNFRLKPGSPGVDAGVKIDAVKTDLKGVPRPQGKAYDAGAYELVPAGKPLKDKIHGPVTLLIDVPPFSSSAGRHS
jgi:parallel beta helix pectate lyase-like protein/uncharacterized protein DUF1565